MIWVEEMKTVVRTLAGFAIVMAALGCGGTGTLNSNSNKDISGTWSGTDSSGNPGNFHIQSVPSSSPVTYTFTGNYTNPTDSWNLTGAIDAKGNLAGSLVDTTTGTGATTTYTFTGTAAVTQTTAQQGTNAYTLLLGVTFNGVTTNFTLVVTS